MNIKKSLLDKCFELVISKIEIAHVAMKNAQESANNEEKSTAGDKHDTARAMSHIERDMYAKQFEEASALKRNLDLININHDSNKIESGSLVYTENGNYFISIGLGKVSIDLQDFLVISPVSPIGQLLLGKQSSESFTFQGKSIKIIDVV